jgi:hypothetical protein
MAKLIATFEVEHNYDDDWNENRFEDEADEQLEKFLEDNPSLKDVKCICVNTGYTDRIIDNEEILDDLDAAVVFTDKCWNSDLKPLIFDQEIHDLVANIKGVDDGSCVFKESSPAAVFSCISSLQMAEYCGCCSAGNFYRAEFYDVDGKIVMVAMVDCESG